MRKAMLSGHVCEVLRVLVFETLACGAYVWGKRARAGRAFPGEHVLVSVSWRDRLVAKAFCSCYNAN